MSYEIALEKALLQHASDVRRNPDLNRGGRTKVPGFMEAHVRGKALQMAENGLLVATALEDADAVLITGIGEAGAERLAELKAEEPAAASPKAEPKKKRWWQR